MSISTIITKISTITTGGKNTATEIRSVLTDMTTEFSGATIYTEDGAIPTTTNRIVTIPSDSTLKFEGSVLDVILGTETLNVGSGFSTFNVDTQNITLSTGDFNIASIELDGTSGDMDLNAVNNINLNAENNINLNAENNIDLNGLIVYKSGKIEAPLLAISGITGNTQLITKEYGDDTYIGGTREDDGAISGSTNLDWYTNNVLVGTLIAPATFVDVNLPTGTDTQVKTLLLIGGAIIVPNYWELIPDSDTYNANFRNYITVDCINGSSGSEIVLYSIKNLT